MRCGIFAPSSPVGHVELEAGLARLRSLGFDFVVAEQTLERHFLFAGTDERRAEALLEFAFDDSIDFVWCARGGYGAGRLIPLLDRATIGRIPPRKLLVGYSDVTVLHEFVRRRWNWSTLHAIMPAGNAGKVPDDVWTETAALIKRESVSLALPVRFVLNPIGRPIEAKVVGGNLALMHSLCGTPFQPDTRGKLIFLEDVSEKLYAIDRYVVQLEQAGLFDECAGVVLGDFTDCPDECNTMLDPAGGDKRVPLRPTFDAEAGLHAIFGRICKARNLPLAVGLPVGHGENLRPLPLGASYRLTPDGTLTLIDWQWSRGNS